PPTLGTATLLYDLDYGGADDNDFVLRDLTSGNGALDYVMYVKDSVFAGASTYLSMYVMFGSPAPVADGTFEEWSAQLPGVGNTATIATHVDRVASPVVELENVTSGPLGSVLH